MQTDDPQDKDSTSTRDAAGGDYMNRLVRLLGRFKEMHKTRIEAAEKWRGEKEYRVASHMTEKAEIYQRCARELERSIAGETPPPAGYDWPDDDGMDEPNAALSNISPEEKR